MATRAFTNGKPYVAITGWLCLTLSTQGEELPADAVAEAEVVEVEAGDDGGIDWGDLGGDDDAGGGSRMAL